ncbi:MAG: hypothetical protein SGJ23_07710 [Alphaproteobacteria bacterium]|mgnify:CR=1 FL=1|nr:hypothetical protein [Alphaproteobacteria bacterium]
MRARPYLDGPIDTAFENAQAHVLQHMPREYRGHAIDKARIALDQTRRLATFTWGGVGAVADAQVVGLYLEAQDSPGLVTWRWGWSTELFNIELLEHLMTLKKWGASRQLEEVDLLELLGHRERFWGLAMICAALNDADGVVGLPRNDAMVLMTIGPLRDG